MLGVKEDPCGYSEVNEEDKGLRWGQPVLLPAPQKFTHEVGKMGLEGRKRGNEEPTFK